MKLLLPFLVGSSWPVWIMFVRGFYQHQQAGSFAPDNCITRIFGVEPYYFYSQLAPLYFGLTTVIVTLVQRFTGWTLAQSFLVTGILSAILISTVITLCGMYAFTPERLREQYLRLQIYHVFTNGLIWLLLTSL